MPRSVLMWGAVLTGMLVISASIAEDQPPKAGTEICNKQYRLVSLEGEKDLGEYRISAIFKEGGKIEVTEHWSGDYRGKRAESKSVVVYESTTPPVPVKAMAETMVDGKVCMKGTVTFSGETVDLECTGFLNKNTGEVITPRKTYEKKGVPKPAGVLVFQSALPTIGPRLLPKEGELKDVVSVEFPDDLGAPELINFKAGYRLVREPPNEAGEYVIKRCGSDSDEVFGECRFDKNDQLVAVDPDKVKLVEVKKKDG